MMTSSLWGSGGSFEVGSHRIFYIWVMVYHCAKFHAGLIKCTIVSDLPLTIILSSQAKGLAGGGGGWYMLLKLLFDNLTQFIIAACQDGSYVTASNLCILVERGQSFCRQVSFVKYHLK